MSSQKSARGYATSSGQFNILHIVLESHFSCVFNTIDILSSLMSRHWIQEFWVLFRLHHSLSDSLDQFRELITEQGQEHLCSLLETKWM